MLQLRVYGDAAAMTAVAEQLDALSGAHQVSLNDTVRAGTALVTADIRADVADEALARLSRLGVPGDEVTLVRLDTIGLPAAATEPLALVWADVLSQARVRARAPARYLVLMAASGVIAALAVLNESPVLIVGAMAISPDLLPITAACTGLVLRRRRLVERGLGTLILGLATTCALATAITAFLDLIDRLPDGFALREIPAAQTHVNATTILVALRRCGGDAGGRDASKFSCRRGYLGHHHPCRCLSRCRRRTRRAREGVVGTWRPVGERRDDGDGRVDHARDSTSGIGATGGSLARTMPRVRPDHTPRSEAARRRGC